MGFAHVLLSNALPVHHPLPLIDVTNTSANKRQQRAALPAEVKAHNRRVKKQNLERIRRANIADKISTMHSLALEMVDEKPEQASRTEKADILSFCFDVLNSFNEILKAEPRLKERVQSLRKRQSDDDAQSTSSDSSLQEAPQPIHKGDEHLPLKKRQRIWRPYLD